MIWSVVRQKITTNLFTLTKTECPEVGLKCLLADCWTYLFDVKLAGLSIRGASLVMPEIQLQLPKTSSLKWPSSWSFDSSFRIYRYKVPRVVETSWPRLDSLTNLTSNDSGCLKFKGYDEPTYCFRVPLYANVYSSESGPELYKCS